MARQPIVLPFYCTLDAKQYRCDEIYTGDRVVVNLGYDESVLSEVLDVDLDNRKILVKFGFRERPTWEPLTRVEKRGIGAVDRYMSLKFRVQHLEALLKIKEDKLRKVQEHG